MEVSPLTYRLRVRLGRTEKSSQNYYIENPFATFSVVRLPITNIIQQQKRFLVNFIFIDFFGTN